MVSATRVYKVEALRSFASKVFLLASLLARVKKYAPQITVRHFFEV